VFEGAAGDLVTETDQYYQRLNHNLKHMASSRGYNRYFESWKPADISEGDIMVEDLRGMFVETRIDPRIESALPMLAKIQQEAKAMKEADIFESWAARLVEGTWAMPDTPEKMTQLQDWLSQPRPLGPDAQDVTDVLYDLIGDDALFDQLGGMAEEDPDADAVPLVQAWITRNKDQSPELSELAMSFQTTEPIEPTTPEAPVEPIPPAEPTEPAPPPVAESLDSIRKLAGMEITENVLNDTGSTLDHIIKTYQRDVRDFMQNNGDMSEHLYDALYDYYQDDMPYGIKKARTGDPYEWIGQRFYDDLQGSHMVDEGGITLRTGADGNLEPDPTGHTLEKQMALRSTPTAPAPTPPTTNPSPTTTPEPLGECNYTMENRYCPKHGLKNCLDEAEYDLGYQDKQLPFVDPRASYVMPANAAEREQDVKDFGHLTKNLNLGNPNSLVNKNVTPSTTSVPFGQNNRTTTGYVMPANDAERAADLKDFGQLTNKFNLGSNKAAPTQNATPAPMEDRMFETELARIKALMK